MSCVNSKRLYLRGLHQDVTEEELYKFLSCYGKITEVKLLPNYAFVQFETEMDASVVLETYQRTPLLGKRVIVEYSHPLRKDMRSFSSSNTESCRPSPRRKVHRHPVIVTGIPPGIGWQELKDFGRLSGEMVAFCDVDRTQRGRGFIEYFSREDASRAARFLDGKYLGGRHVRVAEHEMRGVRLLHESRCSRKSELRHVHSKSRYENAENLGGTWPGYYSTEGERHRHNIAKNWDRYCYDAPDTVSRQQGYTTSQDEVVASNFEKISSRAPRCSSQRHEHYEHFNDYYQPEFWIGYGLGASTHHREPRATF